MQLRSGNWRSHTALESILASLTVYWLMREGHQLLEHIWYFSYKCNLAICAAGIHLVVLYSTFSFKVSF